MGEIHGQEDGKREPAYRDVGIAERIMAKRQYQKENGRFHEMDDRAEECPVQPPDPCPVQGHQQNKQGNAGIGLEKPQEDR